MGFEVAILSFISLKFPFVSVVIPVIKANTVGGSRSRFHLPSAVLRSAARALLWHVMSSVRCYVTSGISFNR
jgi:hypothetical protein